MTLRGDIIPLGAQQAVSELKRDEAKVRHAAFYRNAQILSRCEQSRPPVSQLQYRSAPYRPV